MILEWLNIPLKAAFWGPLVLEVGHWIKLPPNSHGLMGSNITKIRIIPLDWILLYNMISIQEKVCDNDVVKDDYVRRDIWACDLSTWKV